MDENELQITANIAKAMAMMCVRNTVLEDIHGGLPVASHTGDFSDVMVIDANGRQIPWPEASHIGRKEMRDLMRQVVNRLYTFQVKAEDPVFVELMDHSLAEAWRWDEPELDEILLAGIETRRQRGQE